MAGVQIWGTGRRKTAVARVRLVAGSGRFLVNGRSLDEYFGVASLVDEARAPLALVAGVGKLDVFANVRGGGVSGQAGAVRHGLSRALLLVDREFRTTLKKAGFLTRDPRMKERKKYGLKKARKAPQFSKR